MEDLNALPRWSGRDLFDGTCGFGNGIIASTETSGVPGQMVRTAPFSTLVKRGCEQAAGATGAHRRLPCVAERLPEEERM